MVVIIHTHSDDDRGDLWITACDDTERTPLAVTIQSVSSSLRVPCSINIPHQFFDSVDGSDMGNYLRGMLYSSLFIVACGAVVRVQDAQNQLKMVAKG